MELTVTRRDPLLVVSGLPAFFDYTICPDFQRDLAASLEPAPSVLLIDLSGVEFMDSSAIGSLITIRNRLLPTGGQVALCSIAEGVAKVLRIADLSKVFAIYPDEAAALLAHKA